MPLSSYRAFEPALAYAAAETERTMDRLLPKGDAGEARVFEAMRYAALGPGKRLRPFLVLTGSRSIRDVILFPLMRNRDQGSESKEQEAEKPESEKTE